MSLRPSRRLCLITAILVLCASPTALLAASWPPQPPLAAQSAPSILEALNAWFVSFWSESRCGIDPNGGQQCNPGSGGQLPAPGHASPALSRGAHTGTLAGQRLSTDSRCTIDPNGGTQCNSTNRIQMPH